ncbi:tryptophan 7-halogenase [Colwellia sp. 4_MG-2023]|uniref:tryptophan halogenase family protein n=1 Tax=unclassified Colwellia TaxID=196834 RepID=UPI0026E22BF9|nr:MULTISPECIES: tryptophan halogenase family protein [unclassified Colwellia]MDO6506148.1 tryptophan 7-halogenase [Colwellia sp. 5_MG-2023]MDO6554792.1 tryptophan 7-halogenase [Colwellia sp. 4_MG-2023]
MKDKIKNVVIAGGGTAGWMAAAAFAKLIGKNLNITLVESDEISTVGVGEATIPPIKTFHKLLGINEQEIMRATNATFKLGIEFENWGLQNSKYIHSFGATGKECWAGEFHHFWLHGLRKGIKADFGDYCYELQAAKANKFALLNNTPINYAYHLDATLYAKYLRKFSENLGVTRLEGKIQQVNKDSKTGNISSLTLASGQVVEGDFFIDCTGFRGLLIEQALHTGFDDWSHWLPCDSAVAVQTKTVSAPKPYTRSIAHNSGWQWQIPLQNRVGNGLVFCSKYCSDEEAIATLKQNIEGEMITEPRVIKFNTGRRRKGWNKNCVALGLSSGFIEPLESTSIHLIMSGVIRLLRLFPFEGICQSTIDEYNSKLDSELNAVRDFIVLHYKTTEREDTDFWLHCKTMEIPPSLQHKIKLFKETGRVFLDDGDIFRVDSWTQVLIGQGIIPEQYHTIAEVMNDKELEHFMHSMKKSIANAVEKLPSHAEFLDKYCKA